MNGLREFYADADAKRIKKLEAEILANKAEIKSMGDQLQSKDEQLLAKDEELIAKDEIIITCDGKDYTLPFPRSLKDERQTHCLADHVMRRYHARQLRLCPCCQSQHATDFVCPFVVTAGIGLKALQEKYHGENDEYHAIMSKLLCDRLAEALAEHLQEYMQKRLFWGNSGIRMAFGYGACPDHSLKVPVLDMLQARERMGLSLTSSNMISPGESICGLIFANTPVKYFIV